MQVPKHLLWGTDIAIKKLRPGAQFAISGMEFIEWLDPNGLEPPSWEEINEQISKDKAVADLWMANQAK